MLNLKTHTLNKMNSITDIWDGENEAHAGIIAVDDKYSNIKLSYGEFNTIFHNFAAGLQFLGLEKDEHVALFSENSAKWLIADQAILKSGAVDVVRGSQAPVSELGYILNHSDSCALIC